MTSAKATSATESAAPAPARAPARAFVGLGANLGDARGTLEAALAALREIAGRTAPAGARPLRASSLWRSAPVDAAGPDFLNAVALFDTTLTPHALLDALQAIEQRFGRERPYRNAPRTLDLDLLLYGPLAADGAFDGGLGLVDERLELPHPRAHLRAFVLEPLVELWPDVVIPGRGRAVDLLRGIRAAGDQRIERLPD
jgi:2-amino-4-hydroxy-6-hydroxymethyldihydropteridine diphosphokinase